MTDHDHLDDDEKDDIYLDNPLETALYLNDIEVQDEDEKLAIDVDNAISSLEFDVSTQGSATDEDKRTLRHIFACGYIRGVAETENLTVVELIEYLEAGGYLKTIKRR